MAKRSEQRERVCLISLGCSKNLVDSERLASRLEEAGYDVTFDEDDFRDSHVVINTCAFIGDAKEESIDYLLSAIQRKKEGKVRSVRLMGCLGQRYRSEMKEEMPELDAVYGKFDWDGIVGDLAAAHKASRPWKRKLSTEPHYTYIKISEGCNRFCAFCAIPLITGRHTSRPIEEIVEEVKDMASSGTREFNIIAQDLSSYGHDLYGREIEERSPLALLLERLAAVEGADMIRLHYAYPADFPMDILPVMASHPNICKYLDIALQHIDDTVLENMRRHIDADGTRKLLAEIRRQVPGIHIRTTLMVGFPGETDEAFGRLLDFVREQRFERMGAFEYCEEDDTYAALHYSDDIPPEVKSARHEKLMELQNEIADEIAEAKVGKTLRVIVDSEAEDVYICRSEYDSPEVDCEVYVDKDIALHPGDIVEVHVREARGMDLYGNLLK